MEDDEEEEKRKRRKRRRTRTSISRSEYQPEFVRCWSRMCGSGKCRADWPGKKIIFGSFNGRSREF